MNNVEIERSNTAAPSSVRPDAHSRESEVGASASKNDNTAGNHETNSKEFSIDFGTIITVVPNWLYTVIHPIRKCQELLEVNADETRLFDAIQVWIMSFLLTAGIEKLLFKSLGEDFDDKGFWVVSTLLQTLSIIALGFSVQAGLQIRGVKCRLSDLVVMFICYFLIYEPVVAALSYPSDQALLSAIAASKKVAGATFNGTLNSVLFTSSSVNSHFAFGWVLSLFFFIVFFSIGSTMMALEVSDRYSVERAKSLSAMAFSVAVFVPPVYVTTEYLSLYVMYVYWR